METYTKQITRYLYQYGDKENNYLIPLANVIMNFPNSVGDINVYIENKKGYIVTDLGFKYSLVSLTNFERFSILYSIETQICT